MLGLFGAGSHQRPRKSGLLNRYTVGRQLTEHLVCFARNLTTKKVGYRMKAAGHGIFHGIKYVCFCKSLSNKGKVVSLTTEWVTGAAN